MRHAAHYEAKRRARDAAEHAAWLAPGVMRVDDRLRIS